MSTISKNSPRRWRVLPVRWAPPVTFRPRILYLLGIVLLSGCCGQPAAEEDAARQPAATPNAPALARSGREPAQAGVDSRRLILAPHSGNGPMDEQIRAAQATVQGRPSDVTALERLGWLYVTKARASFDDGYTTLAEHCALVLEKTEPRSEAALLLRGHALHSQHRFHEAEPLARELVTRRGLAADYALLGDILVDLGRVDEAVAAYQSMLDQKPDPQGHARAAHVRWLKGDLEGALDLMRMAAAASSPREPAVAAWMHVQWARYLWQDGQPEAALGVLRSALEFQSGFAPAQLLQGRILLARGQAAQALDCLASATRANPLPEYRWALAEAYQACGRPDEARAEAEAVAMQGAAADPRTCALFLATRRRQVDRAVRLARQEFAVRADVFTEDALAWALAAAGELTEARVHLDRALVLGTRDARLWLHAGIIYGLCGAGAESQRWLSRARTVRDQLLPGEQTQLDEALGGNALPSAASHDAASSVPPSRPRNAGEIPAAGPERVSAAAVPAALHDGRLGPDRTSSPPISQRATLDVTQGR